MKLNRLTIQGFRGFSEERSVDFHHRLTLIYAPNSYGKTSISEALEWLLYGVTSKVEKADSKDEYRGSYRNRHLPKSSPTFVRASFTEADQEIVFTSELNGDESVCRFVGEEATRSEVEQWPVQHDLNEVPRPFILQHALKYLLLVKPDERFQGFARLLGFEDLDEIHRNIISLCTAPDRKVPSAVTDLQQHVTALEARVARYPSLSGIQKALKMKGDIASYIYKTVIAECKRRVPPGTGEDALLLELLRIREMATGKVFKGKISLQDYLHVEIATNTQDESFFVSFLTELLIKEYSDLTVLATIEVTLKKVQFFNIGIEFLGELPITCPFCDQSVDDALIQHIHAKHKKIGEQSRTSLVLEKQREKVKKNFEMLKERLTANQSRHISKAKTLLELQPSLGQLQDIFGAKNEAHYKRVEVVITEVLQVKSALDHAYGDTLQIIDEIITSIEKSTENTDLVKSLAEVLVKYVADARKYAATISSNTPIMIEADRVLQDELDTLAGTEDVSILIDMLNQQYDIEKKREIDKILEDLKDLRKSTDQYVANKMLAAISAELTSEVMRWYECIKTTGDPDVHFAGFDMERTVRGDIKARRVSVKAKSYGEDLVSAVSSLSESKLNALGLCVSIATNLRGESPFEFLIIDDPIQSLDAEHETQFIQVIRSLIEDHGKQVIVLSHNRRWLDQLCSGCRSLNGWFYEITSYTQTGPNVLITAWEKWDERLRVVDAILKDPYAGSVKLQQAEEEIRIVVAELTCEIYRKTTGVRRSPHNLNSTQVKKMLLESGVGSELVDRIVQTFGTTDDSHHAPTHYNPDRERIRRYHSWAHELAKLQK